MMRPGTQAPELKLETVGGETWDLSSANPEKFTMVTFYRGLHCPVCKTYLLDLQDNLENFKKQGVTSVIAVSGDSKEKAMKAKEDWNLESLTIGYDMKLPDMAEWGLYISSSIKDSEPKYFGEPGLFIIDNASKLFYCATNSMPFARPEFEPLLKGLQFVNKEDYPRRGTVPYGEIR